MLEYDKQARVAKISESKTEWEAQTEVAGACR